MIRAVALVLLIPLYPSYSQHLLWGTTSFPTMFLSKFVIGANKRWKESKFEMKDGHWKRTLPEL